MRITLFLFASLFLGACSTKLSEEEETKIVELSTQGLKFIEDNDLDSAENRFLEVIKIAPNEASGYGNLGLVYLRLNSFDAAEQQFAQGRSLEPSNTEILWNLAILYRQTNREDEYINLLRAIINIDPEHLNALHTLSEVLKASIDTTSMVVYEVYLKRMIEKVPTNIVPRIFLLEHTVGLKRRAEALKQVEQIGQLFPEWEGLAGVYHDSVQFYLQRAELDNAKLACLIYHNTLKSTSKYRADVLEIKGSNVGVGAPVFSFRNNFSPAPAPGEQNYKNVTFSDATEASKIAESNIVNASDGMIAIGDVDSDGVMEIFSHNDKSPFVFLKNDFGRFDNIAKSIGVDIDGFIRSVALTDYDNDGHLDLYIVADNHYLFNNAEEGKFKDVTEQADLGSLSDANHAISFDADHDGDLDLFVARNGPNKFYRNNGDNTFTELSITVGLAGGNTNSTNALFRDFDSDGDTDLIVSGDSGWTLFLNDRLGRFVKSEDQGALDSDSKVFAMASSDINNDGYSDLFIATEQGCQILINDGNAKFSLAEFSEKTAQLINHITLRSARFLDYDNDGFQDLFVVGTSNEQGLKGVSLLRNDSKGFQDVSQILPDNIDEGNAIEIFDYNEDGDQDILLTNKTGLRLLRNDGGSQNHHIKINLVGLREGSGKNNYFGIGAKIEVRAGSLYQYRTVTGQDVYFGLGANENVDIIRIIWPNGAPQDIFSPMNDRDLVEQQKLKGSCPFLYSWDGEKYVFIKDIMWRSALGMPLGIMTTDESKAFAFPQASKEYIRIPGELVAPKNGNYEFLITAELWETLYIDEVQIYAIDHPATQNFRLDEKIVAPPYPRMDIYSFDNKIAPVSATNGSIDLLKVIQQKDNVYTETAEKSKFQGITEMTELIIDLGEGIPTKDLHLYMNGWIFPSDASINVALSQSNTLSVVAPFLQVIDRNGAWKTVKTNLGFPLGKDKTMIINLTDIFESKDRKIKISTNMQISWDEIFYAYRQESQGRISKMETSSADLHFRGFSREFRKGTNGPHWFDYSQTTTDSKWLDLKGYYTRYGDVLPLLQHADNQYIIANAGDEVRLRYSVDKLPALPSGWKRDFVIYSVGWVKDGDLNTAFGATVEPLPFHEMTSYPYPDNEHYPEQNHEYIEHYNTRWVDNKKFVNSLSLKQ